MKGVDAMESELLKQPSGSRVPLIVDVTDSSMTKKTSERGKQTAAALSKVEVTTATAMVGVTGVKRIIATAISRDVYFAKDLESAKDWAVEHAKT